jgi:hypothetical protein
LQRFNTSIKRKATLSQALLVYRRCIAGVSPVYRWCIRVLHSRAFRPHQSSLVCPFLLPPCPSACVCVCVCIVRAYPRSAPARGRSLAGAVAAAAAAIFGGGTHVCDTGTHARVETTRLCKSHLTHRTLGLLLACEA